MKKVFALLVVFVLVFSLAACNNNTPAASPSAPGSSASAPSSQPDPQPATGSPVEITVAFKWHPNGLDPISEDSGMNKSICYHLYDRLVFFDYQDNRMSPSIAKSWEKIDGTTWKIEINLNDYVFHNGDKLKMEDVEFSILRIKDIPKSAETGMLIESVSSEGNILTLKFTQENNTLLARVLDTAVIVNKAYIEANGDEGIYTKPVGTGPYKVTEFVPGTTTVLETWDGYLLPKPQIDKITVICIPEDAARYIAVETGLAQWTAWMTPMEMGLAEKNDNLATYYGEGRRFGTVCFNCERPPFDNINVRRALAHCINRDAFAALQGGGRPPMKGVLFAGYDLYMDPPGLPEFDLEKAKAMLAAEGFNDSNPLSFQMLSYAPADPGLELYQSTLKSIGVNMEITEYDVNVMMSLEVAGDYEVEWVTPSNRGNHPLADLDRFDYFYLGTRNMSRYNNPRVQEIIRRMLVTDDQQELQTLNVEINTILGQEVPMVGVIVYQNLAAMDKRMSGATIHPNNIFDYRNATFTG